MSFFSDKRFKLSKPMAIWPTLISKDRLCIQKFISRNLIICGLEMLVDLDVVFGKITEQAGCSPLNVAMQRIQGQRTMYEFNLAHSCRMHNPLFVRIILISFPNFLTYARCVWINLRENSVGYLSNINIREPTIEYEWMMNLISFLVKAGYCVQRKVCHEHPKLLVLAQEWCGDIGRSR